jgi:signal peptidase II
VLSADPQAEAARPALRPALRGLQERGPVASLTRQGLLAFAIALVVVVADRVTTSLALDHLHDTRHVWGPFGLSLTFNSGFAFSLFSGRAVVVTVLLCAGAVILALAVARVRTVPLAIGAGLVLGGAIGNLSERIVGTHAGRVPDFVTLDYWPTFNLADACVTVGIVIVIVSLLFGRPETPAGDDGRALPSPSASASASAPEPEREEAP